MLSLRHKSEPSALRPASHTQKITPQAFTHNYTFTNHPTSHPSRLLKLSHRISFPQELSKERNLSSRRATHREQSQTALHVKNGLLKSARQARESDARARTNWYVEQKISFASVPSLARYIAYIVLVISFLPFSGGGVHPTVEDLSALRRRLPFSVRGRKRKQNQMGERKDKVAKTSCRIESCCVSWLQRTNN